MMELTTTVVENKDHGIW